MGIEEMLGSVISVYWQARDKLSNTYDDSGAMVHTHTGYEYDNMV